MNKLFASLAAAGVAVILLAGDTAAQRGRGGRGGPGPGGGRGGVHPGPGPGTHTPPIPGARRDGAFSLDARGRDALTRSAATHNNVANWNNFAHDPFTPAWYAAHPNAWHATHPHADAWVAATAVGLAAWLSVPYVSGGSTTVINEYPTATASDGTLQASVAPEQVDAESTKQPAPTALALAQSGSAEVRPNAEWMPLGVFALRPAGEQQSTRVIQLAVSRDGMVCGLHLDTLTEDTTGIQGAVDKKSLRLAWTIGAKSNAAFEAALGDLTKPQSSVTVQFADGKKATWEIVRIER